MRPMPRALLVALPLALLAGGSACGEGNDLGGSMGDAYSLAFSSVRVRKQDEHLLVEYLHDITSGTEIVCKLVVDTEGLGLRDGADIEGERFLGSVWIQRVAYSGGDFPAPTEGSVHFSKFGFEEGGHVAGHFDALFTFGRPGSEEERDLHGRFDGRAEVVDTE